MKENDSSSSLFWATPRAQMRSCQSVDEKTTEATRRRTLCRLENQAKYWPTPTTKGFDNGSNSRLAWKKRQSWPTPAARDYKGPSGPDHLVNGTGRKHMDQLPNFAVYCLHPDLTKSNSGKKSLLTTQRLNPRFVEWLMGWPLGFTAIGSESSETEWSLWQSLMASHFSRLLTSLESTSKTERQKMLF